MQDVERKECELRISVKDHRGEKRDVILVVSPGKMMVRDKTTVGRILFRGDTVQEAMAYILQGIVSLDGPFEDYF